MNKNSSKKKVIIVDNESEKFTHSDCNCNVCMEMRTGYSSSWDNWVPRTSGEKYYKSQIDKIEKKYTKNNKV